MNHLLKLSITIIILLNFIYCSHTSKSLHTNESTTSYQQNSVNSNPDTIKHQIDNQQIINLIKPHVYTALEYYNSGDFKNAYEEFQNAFTFLDLILISGDSAKINFISKYVDM